MGARDYGERRVAETLVDGAVLLGDLVQQAGRILLRDPASNTDPQIALESDETDGLVVFYNNVFHFLINGTRRHQVDANRMTAVAGLTSAGETAFEPEPVKSGSSYQQSGNDSVIVFDSAPSTLTMLDGITDGQVLYVVNKSATNALALDATGTSLTDVREAPTGDVDNLNTLASTLLYWVVEDSSWYRLF